MGEKVIVTNRRVSHEYHILDRFEAGIALVGTEVKSLRMSGGMTLKDCYVDVESGEMILIGAHIQPYEQGNIYNHDPERPRKLLMHKLEIFRLSQRILEKGLTLIPLRVYFKEGLVKLELGLCRGKHSFDKRASIKERESKRDMERAIKNQGRTHSKRQREEE